MNLTITPAYDVPQEIGELFAEYTGMLLENDPDFRQYLELQNYDDELLHLEAKYGLPDGRLYLARWDGAAAGCIGLRRLDNMRCEMKRLYVRPAFRGLKTGRALAEKLIRADEGLRPTLEPLLHEKKNGRAQRPAVPET